MNEIIQDGLSEHGGNIISVEAEQSVLTVVSSTPSGFVAEMRLSRKS